MHYWRARPTGSHLTPGLRPEEGAIRCKQLPLVVRSYFGSSIVAQGSSTPVLTPVPTPAPTRLQHRRPPNASINSSTYAKAAVRPARDGTDASTAASTDASTSCVG